MLTVHSQTRCTGAFVVVGQCTSVNILHLGGLQVRTTLVTRVRWTNKCPLAAIGNLAVSAVDDFFTGCNHKGSSGKNGKESGRETEWTHIA